MKKKKGSEKIPESLIRSLVSMQLDSDLVSFIREEIEKGATTSEEIVKACTKINEKAAKHFFNQVDYLGNLMLEQYFGKNKSGPAPAKQDKK